MHDPAADPMPRPLRALRALCPVLSLFVSLPAAAATLGVPGITNNSTNVFDNTGSIRSVAQSATSTLSTSASAFQIRFAAVVGADTGSGGGSTFTQNFAGSFIVQFQVTETLGQPWMLDLNLARVGAQTIVHDFAGTNGSASVTLGALSAAASGAGSFSSGTLDLLAVGTLSNTSSPDTSPNSAFNQAATATFSGIGTGAAQTVTIQFDFTANAVTIDPPGGTQQGDEGALRMGLDSLLTGPFDADTYPGAGSRVIANDGIFFGASVAPIPEPNTSLLLGSGLVGLAFAGRRPSVRR